MITNITIEFKDNKYIATAHIDKGYMMDTKLLAVFNEDYGMIRNLNSDKTQVLTSSKDYKSLKGWYKRLNKIYFEELNLKFFPTYEKVLSLKEVI